MRTIIQRARGVGSVVNRFRVRRVPERYFSINGYTSTRGTGDICFRIKRKENENETFRGASVVLGRQLLRDDNNVPANDC